MKKDNKGEKLTLCMIAGTHFRPYKKDQVGIRMQQTRCN